MHKRYSVTSVDIDVMKKQETNIQALKRKMFNLEQKLNMNIQSNEEELNSYSQNNSSLPDINLKKSQTPMISQERKKLS